MRTDGSGAKAERPIIALTYNPRRALLADGFLGLEGAQRDLGKLFQLLDDLLRRIAEQSAMLQVAPEVLGAVERQERRSRARRSPILDFERRLTGSRTLGDDELSKPGRHTSVSR